MNCKHCEQPIVRLEDGQYYHEREEYPYTVYCRCRCDACNAYSHGGQPAYELVAQNLLTSECYDGMEAEP